MHIYWYIMLPAQYYEKKEVTDDNRWLSIDTY